MNINSIQKNTKSLQKKITGCLIILALIKLSAPTVAYAYIAEDVTQMTLLDSGGGVTYQASDFISGVAPTTVIESGAGTGPATVGFVLQPADYLTKTTNGRTTSNNSGFFCGDNR